MIADVLYAPMAVALAVLNFSTDRLMMPEQPLRDPGIDAPFRLLDKA